MIISEMGCIFVWQLGGLVDRGPSGHSRAIYFTRLRQNLMMTAINFRDLPVAIHLISNVVGGH